MVLNLFVLKRALSIMPIIKPEKKNPIKIAKMPPFQNKSPIKVMDWLVPPANPKSGLDSTIKICVSNGFSSHISLGKMKPKTLLKLSKSMYPRESIFASMYKKLS